jgi:CRP/FNR family transcriptional activator FtrB
MRAQDIEEMQALPFFQGISYEISETILRASFLQRFPQHVDLITEGQPADFLHVIIEGQVEMFSAHKDRETTVSILKANDCFIVAAVLLDRIYLQSARVLSPSRILLIPAELVRHYSQADLGFCLALNREMARAYRNLVRELKNQKLRSALVRLANWLLVRHKESGGQGQFELPFDKQTLASHLGLAPAVLSRSFAALIPYHVTVTGAKVEISDLAALEQMAHPQTTIDDLE